MIWFAIALTALVLEVFSGTFYLLVLSIACAITGVLDWAFHTPFSVNITVCAVLSIIGIVLATYWHKKKKVIPMSDNTAYDDLDIGQSVAVLSQNTDGTYKVQYRGAEWQAISAQTLNNKTATIVGKQGNMLVVE
ncbi:MAG: NfeD family protein [Neisseriaceae bacterium]|nr:NfeD family protein [Neisseriaceae bacterium]